MSEAGRGCLPDYDNPPVIEVVCGIQFEPIPQFRATAFGLFWQRIREEYPQTEEKAPLQQKIEKYGATARAEEPQVELTATPPLPRMFFINRVPNWLIQLQPDRFLHNWRKVKEEDVYPHYPAIFEKFWSQWAAFQQFCREEGLQQPKVNQLEITYINHVPAGQGWQKLSDWGGVFPDLQWRGRREFLPEPESAAWRASFLLPESRGRLHASVRHAIRAADGCPVLLCELTARGISRSDDENSSRGWFTLGREWIVRGFADLASADVQKTIWRRRP